MFALTQLRRWTRAPSWRISRRSIPELAQQESVPHYIHRIDDALARKLYVTADFYHRTHEPLAAAYTYELLVQTYPNAPEASTAPAAQVASQTAVWSGSGNDAADARLRSAIDCCLPMPRPCHPRLMHGNRLLWIATSLCLLIPNGCGYNTAGDAPQSSWYQWKSLYRQDVSSVAVPIFKNRSFDRGVEFALSKAIVNQIEMRTPYKVIPQERADSCWTARSLPSQQRQQRFPS